MICDLAFTIVAHALLAAYRSACAAGETARIAWDHLTAPAPPAGGDPLDDGRFAQAPGADWMRAHQRQLARLGEVVAELQAARESLEEMRAQRDQALDRWNEALRREDLAILRLRAYERERNQAVEEARAQARIADTNLAYRTDLRNLLAVVFGDDGTRTATFPTMADAVAEAMRIVAEGHAAREESWDAAQNLSAAQATIEDLRQERDGWRDAANRAIARLREILRAGEHEPVEEAATRLVMFHDGTKEIIAKVRGILGAREGETVVEAAERVTAERKRLEQWVRIPSEPDHA